MERSARVEPASPGLGAPQVRMDQLDHREARLAFARQGRGPGAAERAGSPFGRVQRISKHDEPEPSARRSARWSSIFAANRARRVRQGLALEVRCRVTEPRAEGLVQPDQEAAAAADGPTSAVRIAAFSNAAWSWSSSFAARSPAAACSMTPNSGRDIAAHVALTAGAGLGARASAARADDPKLEVEDGPAEVSEVSPPRTRSICPRTNSRSSPCTRAIRSSSEPSARARPGTADPIRLGRPGQAVGGGVEVEAAGLQESLRAVEVRLDHPMAGERAAQPECLGARVGTFVAPRDCEDYQGEPERPDRGERRGGDEPGAAFLNGDDDADEPERHGARTAAAAPLRRRRPVTARSGAFLQTPLVLTGNFLPPRFAGPVPQPEYVRSSHPASSDNLSQASHLAEDVVSPIGLPRSRDAVRPGHRPHDR